MTLYVAQVGVEYEGTCSLGIYESVDAAMEAIRQYVFQDHIADFVGTDFYEVHAYELGAPPTMGARVLAEGRQADLLHKNTEETQA